ncbi:MAG TPA: TlpA disulfide reductase family protein [Paludibacter sp.]
MAPDFKAIDVLTNRPVTYFEFKGKNVVLIDFWASWCGPCRMAFPHLKDVYKKYHSKGFEIIAASCDVDKKAWLSAIKQDSTEIWHQVHYTYSRIAKYTKDDIYQNYFVQGIPLQLLVNRDGKIIGRWVGYSSENEKELEEKLAELFK